jgi:hypothetical protein
VVVAARVSARATPQERREPQTTKHGLTHVLCVKICFPLLSSSEEETKFSSRNKTQIKLCCAELIDSMTIASSIVNLGFVKKAENLYLFQGH